MLSGVIPKDLGNCISLEVLLMQDNFFHGSLPSSLSSLRGLTDLDISRNSLSGAILLFSIIFLYLSRKKRKLPASPNEENPLLKLSYQSILKATNGSAALVINGNETDRQALLQFKAKVTGDPLGIMRSWNSSVHFCQWIGVECGQ